MKRSIYNFLDEVNNRIGQPGRVKLITTKDSHYYFKDEELTSVSKKQLSLYVKGEDVQVETIQGTKDILEYVKKVIPDEYYEIEKFLFETL